MWIDQLASYGALLPEFSLMDLKMPPTTFKLALVRTFSRDANLS